MHIFAKFFSAVIAVSLAAVFWSGGSVILAQAADVADDTAVPSSPITEKERAAILKRIQSAEWAAAGEAAGPSCFDYYRFQSVQTAIGTNRDKYVSGENVVFGGELINQNDYPVVDGYLFVRISRERANFETEGNDVVDEFFALERVALDAKAQKPVQFSWAIPNDLLAGPYRADYFFSVGKKFNLGGLPFSNDVVVGFAKFEIDNKLESGVFLDRVASKVNGVSYKHIGNWPNVPAGSKVVISQPVKNIGGNDVEVKVTYDLYYWDGLNAEDKLAGKTENVSIPARGSKELKYEIPAVQEPVYYLKITATAGDQKSIVNIRVASDLERPRLNYPALTQFPLSKGDVFTLFSCFHNTSGIDTSGKVVLTLSDEKGAEIGRSEYSGPISSKMMADKKELVATQDYDYLKLSAAVLDKNGKMVDSYEVAYDCAEINTDKCQKARWIYYLGGAVLAALSAALLYLLRKKKQLPAATAMMLVLFSVYGLGALSAEAYNQKSATSAANYNHSMTSQGRTDSIADGYISLIHLVNMTAGNDTVNINDPIDFVYDNSCAFTASGGNWDTPWCGADKTNPTWLYVGSGGNYGYVTWSFINPFVQMVSSNPSVITCSGMNCTAKAAGTAVLTAEISTTLARIWSEIIMDASPGDGVLNSKWYYNYGYSGDGSGLPSFCEGKTAGSWCTGWHSVINSTETNKLSLPAASVSWTITVKEPTPTVSLQCQDQNGNYTNGPCTVNYANSTMLKWSSTNAVSCEATGGGTVWSSSGSVLDGWLGYKEPSGSQSTGKLLYITTRTYSIACKNSAGVYSPTVSVTVNVNQPPTVKISANPNPVYVDPNFPNEGETTLTWSSTNMPSDGHCVASGDWSGNKVISGSATVGSLGVSSSPYVFYLTCTNESGEDKHGIEVNVESLVIPPPEEPRTTVTLSASPNPAEDGGYTDLSWSSTFTTLSSCVASAEPADDSWSGNVAESGTNKTVGPLHYPDVYTYYITCTNAGTDSDAAVVDVNPPKEGSKYGCSTEGACALDANGIYSAPDCENKCVVPPKVNKYGCNPDGVCEADANGIYDTTNCDNTCVVVPKHTACSNNACIVVSGEGANECTSNENCITTYSCANGSCILDVDGSYTTSNCNDACDIDPGCVGDCPPPGTQQHSECVNQACVLIDGAGYDKCANDNDCGGTYNYPYHGLCSSSNICIKIEGDAPVGAQTCSNYGGNCGEPSVCNNNNTCEAGETVDGCPGDCSSQPTYSLSVSGDLSITVLSDSQSYCSNAIRVTATPYNDFNSDISLSVPSSGWGGFSPQSYAFNPDPLTVADYSSGSAFSVCTKPGASSGSYSLTVLGTDGRTVAVKLNVTKKEPSWIEVWNWGRSQLAFLRSLL